MRGVLRLTNALYPAMVVLIVLSFLFSSRTRESAEMVRERVFPLIQYVHPNGAGTLLPGSFLVNFFLPSLALMAVLNLVLPVRFGLLIEGRANIFYYILGLVIAIVEIGTDTVLPLIATTEPWGFRLAVTLVNTGFFASMVLARTVSRGAEREW